MAEFVFVGAIACLLLLDASLVLSIKNPAARIWPPAERASWQYWFTWLLFSFAVIGTLALGALDWDGLSLPPEVRFACGIPVVAFGVAFGLWGPSGPLAFTPRRVSVAIWSPAAHIAIRGTLNT